MAWLHHGIWHSTKKEWTTTGKHTDEIHKHDVDWKEADTRAQTVWDSVWLPGQKIKLICNVISCGGFNVLLQNFCPCLKRWKLISSPWRWAGLGDLLLTNRICWKWCHVPSKAGHGKGSFACLSGGSWPPCCKEAGCLPTRRSMWEEIKASHKEPVLNRQPCKWATREHFL